MALQNYTPKAKSQNGKTGHKAAIATAFCTALGPGDPDDGDAGRQQRGLAIAALTKIKKVKIGYTVKSQSGNGTYLINVEDDEPYCSCPDFELRQAPCKHIYAVGNAIMREDEQGDRPDQSPVAVATADTDEAIVVEPPSPLPVKVESPQAKRPTYRQDWTTYTAAQVNEGDHFTRLLRELCDTVEQPAQSLGRPRLPLGDMVFGAGLKVYSTMSGRRAMTDLRHAHADGLMDKLPNFATVLRYLREPALTPLLVSLIEQSALPLKDFEVDFAIDSTGFGTTTYHRWFDHKWKKQIKGAKWVKAHLMCGVKTNIVTAVEVTAGQSADGPRLPGFTETTAQNFTVREVGGDKAYLSKKNFMAVDKVGGTAYFPFKKNSTGNPGHHKIDAEQKLWSKMYHYFQFHREEYLEHYHKRPNVESTMDMIKSKFGAFVRAKNPTAQVNEALVKVLCHNIVVLIHSMYELGIDPEFGGAADA
ncbi:MAG: transposase [Chloroflexota bacterium]|nr:transposase [Chloroflexota bacterium]